MFVVNENSISVASKETGDALVTKNVMDIAKSLKKFRALTAYPRIKNTKNKYRMIETSFSYVPIRAIDVFYDKQEVYKLSYKDNYNEEVKTVYLTGDNKIYTMNKGYISVDNLGGMDVLLTDENRIAQIVSREKEVIAGDFFKMELKYGNNIAVNGLIVIP